MDGQPQCNPECPALIQVSAEIVSEAAIPLGTWAAMLLPQCPSVPFCPHLLQGTPQPAQSRGLLKQSTKEGSSKCHVGTGQGPEQAQRSLAASPLLPWPRDGALHSSAAGWAAPRQERRHGSGLATGRRLQAGSGTGSGRHTDKARLHCGRLIGVCWKTSY